MSIKKLNLSRIITSSNYLYNFSSSYSNKSLTASYALNASGGGGGTSGTSGAGGSSGTSGTGSPGTSGTSGSSGQSGTSGSSGSSGTSATAGSSGTSGVGSPGTSGSSGESGATGTSGSSGATGTSGSSGATGTSGSSGESGATGTSGSSGATGTSGSSGATGDSGSSGSSGATGTSGSSGESGTSGSSGSSGATGTSGSSGSSGATGTSGSSGATGTSGSSGSSGATGTSGSSGSSGATGTSGSSGASVSVSGTTNRLVKFTSASTIGNTSTVHESGSAFLGVGVSSSLVSRLQVYRSGSNASVLKVDGGSGTLFEVTDNLSGSLFSVNTIAGFPILEVFSNNRLVAGAFGTNALVVSGSSVGIGTSVPRGKLHVQGNITGSQFTSSRRNAIGFSGTASYARRALTASYALNASGGGSTLRTGSTYPITASKTSAIAGGTTNRFVKYTNASAVGQTFTPIFESGSAFVGVGPISTSLVSRLQVYRSGSNASVLKVDGGSGTLFEVTDNLSGSLFSVNTIAGFPILEVFSNNRVVAGAFGTNALVVSGSSVGIGTSVPRAKLHIQGNISGSQFTSSRRNAVGFSGTASYARRGLTASYALNAASGGTTLRTGSTYPITSSFSRRAITASFALAGGTRLNTGSRYPITASRAITASYALASAGGGGGSGTVSSGTVNRLAKYTGATTVGSSAIVYESGSAFIGIGVTSSLLASLQVYRSGSNASVLKVDGGSGTLFEVTDNLSGSLFNVNDITGLPILEVFSNNRVVAGAFGTNALVVSGSSVGIGTTTPQAKLHIIGNISGSQFTSSRRNAVGFSGTSSYSRRALTASFALNASSGGTMRTGSRYPITASRAITASYALASAGGGGGSGTVSSGTINRMAKYTGATTVGSSGIMYESGSAFVGIGVTSSLLASLQVYRSGSNASVLKVDGGSGTLFEVTDNLSGSLFNVNDITGLPILEVFSNNRIVAGTFGTNALVVSGSTVGIGTNRPLSKLDIRGGTELLNTSGSTSSATSASLMILGQNTKGGSTYHDFLYARNTRSNTVTPQKTFRLNNSGSVEIVNNAYSTVIFTLTDAGVLSTPGGGTSDRRVKNNIQYIYEDALPTINQLKPVTFEFKNNPNVTRHGFVAQDVLNIKPDLVLGDGDQEGGTYGLDYDGILAMTVKALQEANAKIEKLEARIVELEKK